MWTNLKKKASMDVGQIGFHDEKQALHYIVVEKRDNVIINRLNKTKEEKDTAVIIAMKEQFEKDEKRKRKEAAQKKEQQEKADKSQRQKEKEERSYDNVMMEENMVSNKNVAQGNQNLEEDFM